MNKSYWMIVGDRIVWSPTPFTEESLESGGDIYDGTVKERSGTTFVIDIQTTGGDVTETFDPDKEVCDERLKELWKTLW